MSLSASLNHLLSMLNAQQIVVLIPTFKVTPPPNAADYFNFIMVIASFDLIPTEPIYDYLLSVDELGALTDNFEAVGFESHFFL